MNLLWFCIIAQLESCIISAVKYYALYSSTPEKKYSWLSLDQRPHDRLSDLNLDYSQSLNNSNDFSQEFFVSNNVTFKNI